jgi:hypothetical protein
MSFYDSHKEIDINRKKYWVDFYSKIGIEYKPTKDFKFYSVVFDLTLEEDEVITNPAICFLLSEFEHMSKNVLSYSFAIDLWIDKCRRNGIKCNRQDVHDAYTYAYGYGCEYEFKYL